MYQDFENIANPELISQFEECYRRAMNESELQEMFESGELTEKDFEPTSFIAVDGEKENEKELNDLPF